MSAQGDVLRHQRTLEALQRKQSDAAKKEAALSQKIASARSAASRATGLSSSRGKTAEVGRLEREFASVQKKRADLTKDIASATAALHKAQQRATDEQSREQRRLIDGLKRQQAKDQQIQEQRLVELAMHRTLPANERTNSDYDAFISHASEDKEELVRPLAMCLIDAGFRIWFDELELKVGDSLRRSIDRGLSSARFGIVVFSPSFFAKNWPQYELDGLVSREMEGAKVILPLWHKVSKNEVLRYSPSLADKVALNTATHTVEELVAQLAPILRQTRRSDA